MFGCCLPCQRSAPVEEEEKVELSVQQTLQLPVVSYTDLQQYFWWYVVIVLVTP